MLRCGGNQGVGLRRGGCCQAARDVEKSRAAELALSTWPCPARCMVGSHLCCLQGVREVVIGRLDQEWLSGLKVSKPCSWHVLRGRCPRICGIKRVKGYPAQDSLPYPFSQSAHPARPVLFHLILLFSCLLIFID